MRCFLVMLPVRVRNWNPFLGSVRFSQSREELNCENTRLFDVGSWENGRGDASRECRKAFGGGGRGGRTQFSLAAVV